MRTEWAAFEQAVRVALRRVDLDPDEAVAELAAQRLEPLARAEPVAGEAQAEHVDALGRPLLHPGEVGVGDADVGLVLLGRPGTAATAG